MAGGHSLIAARVVGEELLALVHDHADWSQRTFGSDADRGPLGALRHLEKESREAQEAATRVDDAVEPGAARGASLDLYEELGDCLILLLDAARRGGLNPHGLIIAARDKMVINKGRTWPAPVDGVPCEHVRDADHTGGGPVG
jgi:hypothetical protein